MNIQGFLSGVDDKAGFGTAGLFHQVFLRAVYGYPIRILALAVTGGQGSGHKNIFFPGLRQGGFQDYVGTGDVLGVEPQVLAPAQLKGHVIILLIVLPYI